VWEVQKYCLLLAFPHLPLAGSIFFSKKMDDTQTHFQPMLCTFWACNDVFVPGRWYLCALKNLSADPSVGSKIDFLLV